MDKPVRGSPFCGESIKSLGFKPISAFRRCLLSLAAPNLISTLRKPSPTAIGASEVVSTPPVIAESIIPRAILLAEAKVACKPVPQACEISYVGVCGFKAVLSVASRVKLISRLNFITAPATTSPTFSSCKLKRSTKPSNAAVSMSVLLSSE